MQFFFSFLVKIWPFKSREPERKRSREWPFGDFISSGNSAQS